MKPDRDLNELDDLRTYIRKHRNLGNRVGPQDFAQLLLDMMVWKLARAAGLPYNLIRSVLTGRQQPSESSLARIAEALGLEPKDLQP